MDHLSASSNTRVTNCQKWSDFSWGLMVFSAQYGFSKFMPRIFKYGDIPNIIFTPDKELNILMYRSPSYLITYRSHILLKMVRVFFGPPCIYVKVAALHSQANSLFSDFPPNSSNYVYGPNSTNASNRYVYTSQVLSAIFIFLSESLHMY